MITKAEAKQRVLDDANSSYTGDAGPIVVLDELTIEKEYGWVFFCASQKYRETGDFRFAIAGGGPVLAETNGKLTHFNSARPIEAWLRDFEATRGIRTSK